MATYLYRLGGWAHSRRRLVLALWLVLLTGIAVSATAFKGQTTNKFSVPGTESQQAQDLLEERFPGAGGAAARVVFAAPEGESLADPEHRAAVTATLERAQGAPEVTAVSDPYETKALTADGRIGFADVIYPVPAEELDQETRDALADTAEPARAAGLEVEFGGGVVKEPAHAGSEGMGMMIGYAVLAITLGSLLAAGLPLLTALIGVGVGIGGITALSGVVDLSETAPTLAMMLGLAVGIDYALFILARHRQHLGDGMDGREAAAQAVATAGSAVTFAGLTVIIALVGLTVVDIPFLTVMGLAAAGTVAVAVLIALDAPARAPRLRRSPGGAAQPRARVPPGRR